MSSRPVLFISSALRCAVLAIPLLTGPAGFPAEARPAAAQATRSVSGQTSDADDIVVTGVREIVVNGRARRCRSRLGDPLDLVDVGVTDSTHGARFRTIVPTAPGQYSLVDNSEQVTGPDYWQRVGIGLDSYFFRAPADNGPMCVGGSGQTWQFAGFRRIIDARAYVGKRVRFTLWVASASADQVSFWLSAGTQFVKRKQIGNRPEVNHPLAGGNTNSVPWHGSHGWTPVLLEIGPISTETNHISYGFDLQGSGDVWIYKPTFEVVADEPGSVPKGDRLVIGSALRE